MVWGAFQGKKKIGLICMGQNRQTAFDFAEQIYDIELGRFWAELNSPISMEDGTPFHRSIAYMK